MNRKMNHTLALWAAGSFVASLALILPHSLSAVSSTDANGLINKPKLDINHCSVVLDSNLPEGKTQWETGDKPNLKIAASNESTSDQDLSFTVAITVDVPAPPMMRTSYVPRDIETLPVTLHVPAGQTLTTDLSCENPLVSGKIRFMLENEKSRVAVAAFSTAKNQNSPVSMVNFR